MKKIRPGGGLVIATFDLNKSWLQVASRKGKRKATLATTKLGQSAIRSLRYQYISINKGNIKRLLKRTPRCPKTELHVECTRNEIYN